MRNTKLGAWTLTELLVVLVITSLLGLLALNAYHASVLRNRRGLATRALAELAAREEDHYLRHRAYAADFAALLDLAADALYLGDDGLLQTVANTNSRYLIRLQGTAQSFQLEARATGSQLADAACQVWTLDSRGVKTASGSAGDALRDCWP